MTRGRKSAGARGRIPAIRDPAGAAVFRAYSRSLRERLLYLRRLIFETASATAGVGALEETLKWGQPSYLTPASKSGSTIRIDRVKPDLHRVAMYFHCQSGLAPTFRALYPDEFNYGGDRSIVFDERDRIAEAALRHCVALALTHDARKARNAGVPASRSPKRK